MVDEGKSAFHGTNRTEGAQLYQFEKKATAGHFDNGAVLVVENLDRLTRAGYETAFEIIRLFTKHGVTVATWSPKHIYPAHSRIDMGQALRLIVEAELALEESQKKSNRLKSAWKSKIEEAQNGNGSGNVATSIVPSWLDVTVTKSGKEVTRTVHPNAHKVAVLNEIYDWYIEGKGLPWIARQLNDRNEPLWGLGKHKTSAEGWNVGSLHKHLTSRTVLGEYEPKTRQGTNAKASKGFVIPDYYPQVITAEKFNRVQAIRKTRTGWTAQGDLSFPNLFTGIAKCWHCGGSLKQNGMTKAGTVITQKNKNGTTRSHTIKTTRSYLKCGNALRRYKCDNKKGIKYEVLEAGLIDVLIYWMQKQTDFAPDSRVGQLMTSVAEQDRQIAIKRQALDQIVENLTAVFSKVLAQKASQLEIEIDADEAQRTRTQRELEIARGTASPQESLVELEAAKAAIHHEDAETRYAARTKANQALRRLIDKMQGDKAGFMHLKIGNALYLRFNPAGECIEVTPLNDAIYTGPNGEIDWHPDDPEDKEYEYVA
jgi:hypothetical protein